MPFQINPIPVDASMVYFDFACKYMSNEDCGIDNILVEQNKLTVWFRHEEYAWNFPVSEFAELPIVKMIGEMPYTGSKF